MINGHDISPEEFELKGLSVCAVGTQGPSIDNTQGKDRVQMEVKNLHEHYITSNFIVFRKSALLT